MPLTRYKIVVRNSNSAVQFQIFQDAGTPAQAEHILDQYLAGSKPGSVGELVEMTETKLVRKSKQELEDELERKRQDAKRATGAATGQSGPGAVRAAPANGAHVPLRVGAGA